MMFSKKPENDLKSRRQKAKEQNEKLSRLRRETQLEKGDMLALILGAFLALLPYVLIILLAYYFISMLIFG
ncbi:MAG TPA: hypothetical protein VFD08_04120 [Clostridia bacterium]|nr:hypothetical protein [Clostridia bacterium]